MAQFVRVPPQRLQPDVLMALLQEYASRDGTDYGEREVPLLQKVASLEAGLHSEELYLLYDSDSEQWDIVHREAAQELLNGG